MSGTFRITCDHCGIDYSFPLPCKFGALDGPNEVARLLKTKEWLVEQNPDGSIAKAICPVSLKKMDAEVADSNRGDWPKTL